MKKKSLLLIAGWATLLLGCRDSIQGPTSGRLVPRFSQASCNLQVASARVGSFVRYWPCGYNISIHSDPTNQYDVTSALQTAASRWNAALDNPLAGAHPTFTVVAPTVNAEVTVKNTSGGATSNWCGNTSVDSLTHTGTVNVYPSPDPHCNTNAWLLANTLTHELGHVLGFTSATHHSSYFSGISTHCVMDLFDVQPAINPTPCEHEVERIYASYGMVPLAIVDASDFLSHNLVTGLNASPNPLNLVLNQTDTVTASQLLLANGYVTSAGLQGATLTWLTDNFRKAQVTDGVVTAIDTGNTTIRAKVNASSLPSTYVVEGLMAQFGQEISVHIDPVPPPGPGFRVTSITGVPQPITSAGYYTFQAQVVNGGDPATLQIKWDFEPSQAVFDSVHTGYGSTTYRLLVPAGSYNIHVTASPRNIGVYGGAYVTDYPVCTSFANGPYRVGGC